MRKTRLKAARTTLVLFALIAGCSEPVDDQAPARILAMGDSMLAWHKPTMHSISDVVERRLHEPVVDRSVVGARYLHRLPISGALGLNISKQYQSGNWDWVILNGGGNDLWLGCGCIACDSTVGRLISEDGRHGELPRLVNRLRNSGARVVFLGYLHSPNAFSIVDHCKDEDVEYEERIASLAEALDGFYFLRLSKIVPAGDRSFHAADLIHPSRKANEIIGQMVADLIIANDFGGEKRSTRNQVSNAGGL